MCLQALKAGERCCAVTIHMTVRLSGEAAPTAVCRLKLKTVGLDQQHAMELQDKCSAGCCQRVGPARLVVYCHAAATGNPCLLPIQQRHRITDKTLVSG